MLDMIKGLMMALIDILWPKSCHICSKIIKKQANAFDKYICADCYAGMKRTPAVCCQLCGSNLNTDNEHKHLRCRYCSQNPPAYQRLLSCYQYEGPVKKLIHSFKYERRPYLAKSITQLIQNRLSEHDGAFLKTFDYLVAVPLHPARLREREFNQSELIAKELSKGFNKPVLAALKKIKHTKSQTTLNRMDRFTNLNDAFALNKDICVKGKNILIIDDVATTTATIKEISTLLKQSGAGHISILTFAKGSNDETIA